MKSLRKKTIKINKKENNPSLENLKLKNQKTQIVNEIVETLITNDSELPLENYVLDKSWVIVCPDRWATLPSLVLDGVEIFYNDPERRNDLNKKIREWFWMWPQAWPFTSEQLTKYWYNLDQHWFLRDVKRKKEKIEWKEIWYNFETDENTLKQFPHPFIAYQKIELGNKWARISLNIENKWENTMKFAPWHHTYYKISPDQKENIKLSDNMWVNEEMKSKRISWTETVKISNPWSCQIFLPWTGSLQLNFDKKFKYLRLRSEKDKWFVCIEPAVCRPNEWDDKAIDINPGEIMEIWFSITLLSKDKNKKKTKK